MIARRYKELTRLQLFHCLDLKGDGRMVFTRLIPFGAIWLSGVWFVATAQSPSGAGLLSTDSLRSRSLPEETAIGRFT